MWHMRWMMGHKRGLRMLVLSLLGSGPKNGVEIMDDVEGMTHGRWRPSPGSVYPVLEQLVSEGLIRKGEQGRYELTARARDEIDFSFGPWGRRSQSADESLQELSSFVAYFEELQQTSPAKIARHLPKLRELGERLSRIGP